MTDAATSGRAARARLIPVRAAASAAGAFFSSRAECVERVGLRVEIGVGALAQLDDLRRQPALLFGRLGVPIVELLPDRECLRNLLLRSGEDRGEVGGRRIAELRDREAELLLAGLERVVELHEQTAGALVEFLLGHAVWVLGGLVVLAVLARPGDEEDTRADHGDRAHDWQHGDAVGLVCAGSFVPGASVPGSFGSATPATSAWSARAPPIAAPAQSSSTR